MKTSLEVIINFMKFIYQEHSLKPGIYKILNTLTNRIYIGQAKEFKERWSGHRYSLCRNKCMNRFLQADFNKSRKELGHDDFLEFHVLEVMENSTKEERNQKEEEWIQQFYDQQNNCYNFKQKVESNERSCWSSNPSETSKKISIATKGRKTWNKGLKLSEEHRLKLSEAHIGKTCSQETKLKMSESHKREKAPWFGKKLSEKHREKLSKAHKNQENSNLKKELVLIGPDGTEHHVCGINQFIKEQHLSSGNMFKLLRGELNEYKGWKLICRGGQLLNP